MAIFFILGVNFLIGRHLNSRRAHMWLEKVKPALDKNFNLKETLEETEFDDNTSNEF